MPPSVLHVLRVVLVALVGAIASVVINSFDTYNDDPRFDDHDDF